MTWEKQTRHPDDTVTWEPLSKVRKSGTDEEKKQRQKFAALMKCRLQPRASSFWDDCDCDPDCLHPHARVGQRRQDGTEIAVIGDVRQMHGPDGCCTCCHNRSKETP